MKPIHLLIALTIIIAFAFLAYRGGDTPVQASSEKTPEPPRITQQRSNVE